MSPKRLTLIKVAWISLAAIFLILGKTGFAAPPAILSYQGRLTNASGDLLGGSSGVTYYFRFAIWSDLTGGSQLWPASTPAIVGLTVQNGVFNALIGDTTAGFDALTYDFQTDPSVFLRVEISTSDTFATSEALAPRQRIVSSGFAINADTVDGASAGTSANNLLQLGASGEISITGNITTSLDAAINGGDLTTSATTFNFVNATATTLNIGGAATTVSLGAATGTTTVNNALTVTGTFDANGDVTIADTNIAFDGASTTFTTTGAFTLTPGGAVLLGDGGDTLQINTDDWDISTDGAMTGIGAITSDGLISTSGGLTVSAGDIALTDSTGTTWSITNAGVANFGASATIAGSADGTNALTLTLGDIEITNGDLDVLDGDFNVDLDAGDGVNITKGAAPTVDVFTINGGTSATDGVDTLQLTMTADDASGNIIDISPTFTDNDNNGSAESWNVIDIDALTVTHSDSSGNPTATVNGLSIGALTESGTDAITSTGIAIGTGWDDAINVNSGTFIAETTGALAIDPNTTGTMLDFELATQWTTGTLMNANFAGATTQTGAMVGLSIDLGTNVTGANGVNQTGIDIETVGGTFSGSGTESLQGIVIDSDSAIIQNTLEGTVAWNGINVTPPTITQTTGAVTASGVSVNIPSTPITTGGTVQGLSVVGPSTGPAAGSLFGINVSVITTPGAGTETALTIGTGWDTDINATTSLEIGIGGTNELILTSSALSPSTTDSNALGTGTLMWSDLFLASEGVINFNNGDVTLTHAADSLSVAGGDFNVAIIDGQSINFDGDASPTADIVTIGSGDTSATDGVDTLQLTMTADDASGNIIDITPTFTDNDVGNNAETWNVIDIDAFTVTQNDSGGAITGIVRGINIGALTESASGDDAITSTGILMGSGYDDAININSGTFIAETTGALAIDPNTTGTMLDFELATQWTTGTLINANFAGATTQSAAMTGLAIDLGTNVTGANSLNQTLIDLETVGGTFSGAGEEILAGINVDADSAIIQNTDIGQVTWRGVSVASPNVTQTTGTVQAAGFRFENGTITTGGTQIGFLMVPTGVGAGTLNAFSAGTISAAGAGTETALAIGSGWDDAININSGTFIVETSGALAIDPNTTGTMLDFELATQWDSGTLIVANFGAANTQTGDMIGAQFDFDTNLTGAEDLDITGTDVVMNALTAADTAVTTTYTGYNISAAGALSVTDGANAAVVDWRGLNVTMPAITQNTADAVTADGVRVLIPASSSITTGGTMNGIRVVAPTTSGPAAGTLNGVNIAALTSAGAGTETALAIGAGWDVGINLNAMTLVNVGNAGTDFTSTGGLTLDDILTINDEMDIVLTDGENVTVTYVTSAPTVDMFTIANTGLGTITTGVAGLQIDFITATDSTSGDTNAAILINPTFSGDTGDTTSGILIGSVSGSNATEQAITINSGWDDAIYINSGALIAEITGAISSDPTTTGTMLDFELATQWTLGTLINANFASGTTQGAGDIVGLQFDFDTNLTGAVDRDITGTNIIMNALTADDTAVTTTYIGYNISASGALSVTDGANAAVVDWRGLNVTMPAITQNTADVVTADGVRVLIPASSAITTGGTMNGIRVVAPTTSGPAAGTLNGINIAALTSAGNGAETGLAIGTGWDDAININSGTLIAETSGALAVDPNTTGTMLDFELATQWTTGTLINANFAGATTQTAAMTGLAIDLGTNVTGADAVGQTVIDLETVGGTYSGAGMENLFGINIDADAALVNSHASGMVVWQGANITMPAMTQSSSGMLLVTGMNVTSSTITTAGTAKLLNLTGVGVGAGTLTGLSIAQITAGDGTETGISIGSGWDLDIDFGDTSPTIRVANAGTISFTEAGGAGVLMTITDAATTATVVEINGELTLELEATGGDEAVCATPDADDDITDMTLSDCDAAPVSDYAERYPVAQGITYGDIVVPGTKQVRTEYPDRGRYKDREGELIVELVKSSSSYQEPVAGIVANNYGDFTSSGNNIRKEDNPMPVALVGRVPVNVTNENGPIAVGDFITTSSTPGAGMRAARSGRVIGMALGRFDGERGQVMVQVLNTFWTGPDQLTASQNSNGTIISSVAEHNMNMNGYEIFEAGRIVGISGAWSISQDGNLQVRALTVGSPDRPAGITLHDEVTGSPSCVSLRGGEVVVRQGVCGTVSNIPSPQSSPTGGEEVVEAPSSTGGEGVNVEPTPAQEPSPAPASEPAPETIVEPVPEPVPESSPSPSPTAGEGAVVEEAAVPAVEAVIVPEETTSAPEAVPEAVTDAPAESITAETETVTP